MIKLETGQPKSQKLKISHNVLVVILVGEELN